MNVTIEKAEKAVFMKVEGRIDTTNYIDFENAVSEILSPDNQDIYLDCSSLNYISSSGLRVFLTVQKKMMAWNGKFKLYSMQPGIKEIFDISGFSSIFAIFPDRDSATGK